MISLIDLKKLLTNNFRTIQRLSVIGLLEDNPSLTRILEERIAKAYPQGVLLAVKETSIDKKTFPASCPYSTEELLDRNYYPDGP